MKYRIRVTIVTVALIVIAVWLLLGGQAQSKTTCYYSNGKTVCCWPHVNGRDYVCN